MRMSISLVIIGLLVMAPVWAVDNSVAVDSKILVARVQHDFDGTLEIVEEVLHRNGFKVAHVQRCDGGLKEMGYKTDKYRIVFFGRLSEVREISQEHPEFIPFLPFKALIYAEGEDSVVSILNPQALFPLLKDRTLSKKLEKWKREFELILQQTHDFHK